MRLWSKENNPKLLVGVQTCLATMEASVVIPQEDGNFLSQEPAVPL